MVSCLANPHRGHVSTDWAIKALMSLFVGREGIPRVARGFHERTSIDLVQIEFHRGGFLVEVDFRIRYPGHLSQRLPARDRTQLTRDVLHIQDNGLRICHQRGQRHSEHQVAPNGFSCDQSKGRTMVRNQGDLMRSELTIGKLAAVAGVNIETIRYYQRRGLLDEPEKP